MSNTKKEVIVIVGYGWVGQANAIALRRMGYDVSFYDVVAPRLHYVDQFQLLYQEINSLQTLLQKDSSSTWYIVCIGDRVSEAGEQDISLISAALNSLRDAQGRVILRSTILPNLLDSLPFDVYLPEFLHEIRAVEESLNPYYFVAGMRREIALPSFLEAWQSRAYKIFQGQPREAAYIKYLSNIWNAARVAFVNEFGNSIGLPTNDVVRKETERIIDFIFEGKSYLRYGQAFGGHCLPKDLRAYIRMSEGRVPVPLLQGIAAANEYHQQVVKKYPTLTQWFSTWDYEYFNSRVVGTVLRSWRWLNAKTSIRWLRHLVKPIVLSIEHKIPEPTIEQSKEHWEKLAVKNPYYYAHPDTKSGEKVDEFEVRESGGEDYAFYVANDQFFNDANNKRVLEIGSGVGRLTEFFAKNFKEVHALDISPAMLGIAKKRFTGAANIVWTETPGATIPAPNNHFDLIFSYDVFKYFARESIVRDYFSEIARTLKPGALAKLQLRTGAPIHRWWWFYGVALTPERVRILLTDADLEIVRVELENPKSLWVWARKKV